jgi:hypothetical protein
MATTTPNFGWPVPTSTDLVKDGATAIEALGDSIDASLLDLKGGTSGQVLAKNSNTDMDFIWVTDAAGDITGVTAGTGISGGGTSGTVTITNSMATAIDAKGDLVAGTGADAFSRLAVGANGTVLTADSAEATGLKWATAGGGLVLITATPFTSSTAVNVDSVFSSTYKNYRIVISLTDNTNEDIRMRVRSGGTTYTGSTYEQRGYNSGASLGNISLNTQAQWFLGGGGTSRWGSVIDIYNPFTTSYTAMTSQQIGLSSGITASGNGTNSWMDTSRSDDGFTIYGASTGQLTGIVSVYGYKE